MPKITMIAAATRDGVIGLDGDMPWHIPEDLAHFKKTTGKFPVVMGRKTWESLPVKPLPGRKNIILTRNNKISQHDKIHVIHKIDQIFSITPDESQIFIIGGAGLYDQFYPIADEFILTRILNKVTGDTVIELPENKNYELKNSSPIYNNDQGYSWKFETWINQNK